MKVIIAGAGEVGSHLAKMLSNENQDITLLDSDADRLAIIDANYNLLTWHGSTSSMSDLKDIGVANADLYIAVTPYETRNITSCAIAKQLGATKTVARIDNSEFLREENTKLLKNIGVDHLIYPENIAAQEIARSLEHNWARYWAELLGGRFKLIGVKMRNKSPLINCKIKDMPTKGHIFHIVAIKRDNETIIPGGNDVIRYNDILYFVTIPEYVEFARELCGKEKKHIKKVMIVGGSRTALRFMSLYGNKYDIKIIDSDREHCETIAEKFPDAEVVCSDGRDIETLRDNNISQYDAFMALTPYSETNILACLTAKEAGVIKTIADVENLQFLSQADNLNIGTSINKKLFASSHIFKYLLATDPDTSKCLSLADAEVAELSVGEDAKITRHLVKDLKLPSWMTLAGLRRGEHSMLIEGNTLIKAGDVVAILCLNGMLHKAEKWFIEK